MSKKYVCGIEYVNTKAVHEAKSKMIDNDTILKVVNYFKILGDATRMKILYALSKKGLCVCDLTALLGMTQSAVSHQLQVLRSANLVKFRRDGKIAYYSLLDKHVKKFIETGVKHAKE